MGKDYPAKPRSDLELREIAKRSLRDAGLSGGERVDVIAMLRREVIDTVFGRKKLFTEVVPDVELTSEEAVTTYDKGSVTIRIRRSVYDRAKMGVGRDRFTIAHELGHAVLHEGADKARGLTSNTAVRPKWIKPYESAERQANVFAAALLIDDKIAETLESAEEISIHFGVSETAANIYFEALFEKRNRAESAVRVERMAADFRAGKPIVEAQTAHLPALCSSCGQRKLRPFENKIVCDGCGFAGDHFQDGDSIDT